MTEDNEDLLPDEGNFDDFDESIFEEVLSSVEDSDNGSDIIAKKESRALSLDTPEQRLNHKQKTWHVIVIWGLRVVALSLGFMFLVRVWHMTLPATLCWLTDEQISSLNEIIFGGLIGTIIGKQIDQILSR